MKKMLFLCCVPIWLCAQNLPTSEAVKLLTAVAKMKEDTAKVNGLNKLSILYKTAEANKALQFGKNALLLAEKIHYNEGVANAHYAIAANYSARFDYVESLQHLNKALPFARDQKMKSKIYTSIGAIYTFKSNYSSALDYYLRALQIDESLGDHKGMGTLSMNIATVYYSTQNFQKATEYLNKALAQNVDDLAYKAALLREVAVVYSSMNLNRKALDYFEQSLSLSEKISDNVLTATLLSDLALVYYDEKDFDHAIDFGKKSIKTHTTLKDKVNIAFSLGVIGDAYTEKARLRQSDFKLLDSALSYLEESIKLHSELKSVRGLYDDYTSLTEVRKLQGNYKEALSDYQTAIEHKDEMFNSENRETIKNLEDRRSIEIRDRELKINRLRLETKRKQQWYLIGGLALLAIIGGLLLYQNNIRKRNNNQLRLVNDDLDHANKIKTRLLGILNHDLKSPVNSFIHYIQFRNENPGLLDESAKIRIEQSTLSSAKNLLHSMEDILLWTKDQMENFEPQSEKVLISSVFEDTKNHFAEIQNVCFTFENTQGSSLETDENYLKTIVRNLTANAVNALNENPKASIIWKSWQQDNQIFLSISDNGKGLSEAALRTLFDGTEIKGVQSGLGLHLVRDLAKAINCVITAESKFGEGTTITLAFRKKT